VFWGYLIGAALMAAAGVVEVFLGVEAAGRELEEIAKPLSAEDDAGTSEPRANGERLTAGRVQPNASADHLESRYPGKRGRRP
jgi:hypothetical protein